MSDWREVRLGDVCEVRGRIGWRGYTLEDIRDEGPIVIGAKDISRDQRLDLSSPTYLSREKFEESPEIKVQRNDILVVKVGNTIGKVAFVKDEIGEACINPNTVIVRPRSVEPRYVYYVLTSDQGQHFLKSNSSASAQPAINQTTLRAFSFRVPDAAVQKSIAEILGALDDKIDLNRRINATLEAMVRATFKDWFVDFGPTRSKMEGSAPYLAPDTWALFPGQLDADDKPQGWKSETVLAQADWINGAAYKNMHFVEPTLGLPVVKIAELKNGITSQTKFTNTDLGNRYRIKDG